MAHNQPRFLALQFAAATGDLEKVQRLLHSPPAPHPLLRNVNATPKDIVAALRDEMKEIRSAIAEDINAKVYTALHCAAYAGHVAIVEALINAGADVDDETKFDEELEEDSHCSGQTALHFAAEAGHVDVINILLAAGADKNKINDIGCTALHLAIFSGHLGAVHACLAAGMEIDAGDEIGLTPLHAVTEVKNGCGRDIAAALLAAGANVDAADNEGLTALMHSVWIDATCDALGMVELLLSAGANINALSNDRCSAIHYAAKYHSRCPETEIELVKMFLVAGADVNAANSDMTTPLHFAAAAGKKTAIEVLLVAGASINAVDKYGCTPLFSAAYAGDDSLGAAKLLINAGAEISGDFDWESYPYLYPAQIILAKAGYRGWDKIPVVPCAGLETAFLAVAQNNHEDLSHLFSRLEEAPKLKIATMLRCFSRLGPGLEVGLRLRIIGEALL